MHNGAGLTPAKVPQSSTGSPTIENGLIVTQTPSRNPHCLVVQIVTQWRSRVAVKDLVAGDTGIPNSRHRGAIFPPSSRRAINRSRSSIGLHFVRSERIRIGFHPVLFFVEEPQIILHEADQPVLVLDHESVTGSSSAIAAKGTARHRAPQTVTRRSASG